ncbi:MAG: 4Fe-4S binding protein [Caldilineaceae bacterium]
MSLASDPLPIIDVERCVGCRACVDVCPTNALTQAHDKAELTYPKLCTYCTACQDICPEHAIALPFLVVFKKKSGTTP